LEGHPAATTVGDNTGITMVTDTDQPGIQLYTSNEMGDMKGKGGKPYGFHSAFCLETQHYPDCIHHPQWPSCILRAGETFRSFTTYTFI
jgi:aldose 1-epimerase